MKATLLIILLICTSFYSFSQEKPDRPPLNERFKQYMKNDKGIHMVQKDSLFSATFQFRMQNRAAYYSASERDFTPEQFEFRIRRLRMKLKGFVYTPKLTYYVQLSFSRADMDWDANDFSATNSSPNVIRDAMINYKFNNIFSIGFGQTKLPGNRQRVISSGDLQFADRSIVNSTFTNDRDFGFFGTADLNKWVIKAALTSGEGRNSNKSNYGLSYTGRIEYLPFGKFTLNNDYIEGDLAREPKPKVSIGASYNFNHKAIRRGGQLGKDLVTPSNLQTLHLDFLFKYKGFAVSNEYSTRISEHSITNNSSEVVNTYVGYGNNIQVSYIFKNNFEIAGRYVFIAPYKSVYNNLDFPQINEKREEQIHLGITKYIYGHRVKIQGNLVYQIKKDLRAASQRSNFGAIFQFEIGI